jgi:His-Xaa-Ser system radical SAM maturase HxsC
MIKLVSSSVVPLGPVTEEGTIIRRVTETHNYLAAWRGTEYCLIRGQEPIPEGFAGYLFLEMPKAAIPPNSFLLDEAFAYLRAGDVIRIAHPRSNLRVLYRKSSPHNSIFTTDRCNNYCLMCSQPPKEADDSFLVDEILRTIPLMSSETQTMGISGGEPTLLGDKLVDIVRLLKSRLPRAGVHMLSNGRNFKDFAYAKAFADLQHPDFMIGVPLYSDLASGHDYVVQADGAFDDTIRGIVNLKTAGVRVEIRVVLHKATYERLPDLARFIRRNLTFCDQVVFMGLEMTGFTKINLDKLWIDPLEYQPQLKAAVKILDQARMHVSIYNHQLCLLDPSLRPFSRKSISDWKNEFMPECEPCTQREQCGGFFSSAKLRYSDNIKPFTEGKSSAPELQVSR